MTKDIKKLCIFFSLFQSLWLPYIVTTLVVASRNFIITVLNASISSKAVEMVENGTFYWNVLVQMGIWIVIFAFYDSMGIFSQTTIIHRIGVTLRKKMFVTPAAYILFHCGGRKLGIGNRIDEVHKQLLKESKGVPFITAFTFGEYGYHEHSSNICGGLMLSFTSFGKN